MRIGMVRGRVVLNSAVEPLTGTTLLIVEPVNAENLTARNGAGGGKTLVVADRLSPHEGQMIGFVEGREAANAYWPTDVPVDAYCALIVENYDFQAPKDAENLK